MLLIGSRWVRYWRHQLKRKSFGCRIVPPNQDNYSGLEEWWESNRRPCNYCSAHLHGGFSTDFSICLYAKVKVKIFYLCINLGCLSPIATTEMERSTGFWTAYLLCLYFFVLGVTILIAEKRYYVVHPPNGSIIINAFKAMWIDLRYGGNMGKSTAAATLVSLSYLLLITLQTPPNRHTKMSAETSIKCHGTMFTSMSSSVGLRHVVTSFFTQCTGSPTRKC